MIMIMNMTIVIKIIIIISMILIIISIILIIFKIIKIVMEVLAFITVFAIVIVITSIMIIIIIIIIIKVCSVTAKAVAFGFFPQVKIRPLIARNSTGYSPSPSSIVSDDSIFPAFPCMLPKRLYKLFQSSDCKSLLPCVCFRIG